MCILTYLSNTSRARDRAVGETEYRMLYLCW